MKFKILGLLLSAGLVLAACGNDDDDKQEKQMDKQQTSQTSTDKNDDMDKDNQNDTQSNDQQSSQMNNMTTDVKDIQTEPEKAIETAQKEFDGQVKNIEYKQDNGEWVYKIDLVNGQNEAEVKVSDKDNKVLTSEQETEDDMQEQKVVDLDSVVSYKDAIKTAQKEMKGDLKQWKLNHDNGKLVYEVELVDQNKESEVIIDAKTGKVKGMDH
ncbi:hypothetical protein TP70_09840 [Staphylococcus microti]|uniref:Putative lipoprotein n=1 Tax=Staphylococcus microti TaxID=569857 RepID=A0A0D6XN13_9STAP|nr:PepSY domain-containing protein [Staphylococcus microti]KIX90012.1 hypothetical protein TP70_09840 [Staphylococcus microti]PNZ79944.1 hypothetical protein CD132_08870 [Staphylococcus microti]SUM57088.1 putative lipoprotein [Staphylococcus microti]